ncbi:hypothetical protein CR513_48997, partial [Mucuna pruriens]
MTRLAPGPIPLGSEKLSSLEERVRVIEGTGSHGMDATNLYLVPAIVLPPDFKVPKFEKYKGNSYPRVHLAMYCRKMTSYIHQDKILVHYFQDNLMGAALRWYVNLENIAPDGSHLQNLSKANSEGFKDYAQRWRKLAAQANTGNNFTKKIGYEKKKGEANAILIDPAGQDKSPCTAQIILNKLGASTPIDLSAQSKVETTNTSNAPNNQLSGRNRVFSPIPMTYTTLFPLLLQKNMIAILLLKPLEPPYPKSYDPYVKCDYHAGAVGHSTERCWGFKHKENEPNMNSNPLPAHGGQSINALAYEPLDPEFDGRKENLAHSAQVVVLGQDGDYPPKPFIIR